MASPAAALSPSLFEFVEKVWKANEQKTISSANKVYDLYGESSAPQYKLTWRIASDFADTLLALEIIASGVCKMAWQRDQFERDQQVIINAFTTMKAEAQTGDCTAGSQPSPETRDLLTRDFIHFLNNRGAGTTTERIYIHLQPPIAKSGLKVMSALLRMFSTNPQFISAKICGACMTDRVDSIVAYFSDSGAADAVVVALSSNAALHGCFKRGVPLVVNEVTEGIGRAQEPPVTSPLYARDGRSEHPLRADPQVNPDIPKPYIGFITENTSFGKLHSELIFAGLRQWRANNPKAVLTGPVPQTLIAAIVAAYGKEGIDPKNPSQFANRQQIETGFQNKMLDKYNQAHGIP